MVGFRWYRLRRRMRSSIWVVPVAFTLLALGLSDAVDALDRAVYEELGGAVAPETARESLSSITSGMLVFTGLVFSGLLLVIQFGSTSFSPRALSLLREDRTLKLALGVFCATFVYSLGTLSSVGERNADYVPEVATAIALLLLLASVGMFLALVQRLVSILRAASALREIGRRGRAAIARVHVEPLDALADDASGEGESDRRPGEPILTHAGQPAVVVAVDHRGLAGLARRAGTQLSVVVAVGDPVIDGDVLVRAEPGATVGRRALRRAFVLGDERSTDRDPGFALRLLVDVAVRSLPPAVNDPSTVVQALDQVEDLLRRLADRRLGPDLLRDRAGTVRVRWPGPDFDDYLRLALTELVLFGSGSPQVARRLRVLLDRLAATVPPERAPAVRAELDRLDAAVATAGQPPKGSRWAGVSGAAM